jgi:hypothetical protein
VCVCVCVVRQHSQMGPERVSHILKDILHVFRHSELGVCVCVCVCV